MADPRHPPDGTDAGLTEKKPLFSSGVRVAVYPPAPHARCVAPFVLRASSTRRLSCFMQSRAHTQVEARYQTARTTQEQSCKRRALHSTHGVQKFSRLPALCPPRIHFAPVCQLVRPAGRSCHSPSTGPRSRDDRFGWAPGGVEEMLTAVSSIGGGVGLVLLVRPLRRPAEGTF